MITSIHRYELAASADPSDFYDAVDEAVDRGVFDRIPGLAGYQILHGIKGERTEEFAAVWMYESRAAWRDVWGPVSNPVPKAEYPDAWLTWEEELLDPILAEDPDEIEYTSYEVITEPGDE